MTEENRLSFLNLIFKIASGEEIDKQRFQQNFLDLFSETEENISCLQHIEVGATSHDDGSHREIFNGLKIRNRNLMLSYVISTLQDYPFMLESVPEGGEYTFAAMDKEVASLSQEEWKAIIHFLTLFMSILDKVTIIPHEQEEEF